MLRWALGLTNGDRKELKYEVEQIALQPRDCGCWISEGMDTKATAGRIQIELRQSEILSSNKIILIVLQATKKLQKLGLAIEGAHTHYRVGYATPHAAGVVYAELSLCAHGMWHGCYSLYDSLALG